MKTKSTHSDLQLRFGVVIRQSRRSLGITQEELAGRAGLHRSYVADVERGARNISIDVIERVAEALNVSISDLFARAAELSVGSGRKGGDESGERAAGVSGAAIANAQ